MGSSNRRLLNQSIQIAHGLPLATPTPGEVQPLDEPEPVHQTHHRGQVTTLPFQAGIDPGTTDLLALI